MRANQRQHAARLGVVDEASPASEEALDPALLHSLAGTPWRQRQNSDFLASGQAVSATRDNEHEMLWRALPWSHGTLGLLVGLRLRVVPASPYVRLTYHPCRSAPRGLFFRIQIRTPRRSPASQAHPYRQ